MNQTKVSYKRHLAKTISYRVVSTTIGFLAMWWATESIKIGAAFGIVELVYKPIQYYLHERVWYKYVKFGIIQEKKKKVGSSFRRKQSRQTSEKKNLNHKQEKKY